MTGSPDAFTTIKRARDALYAITSSPYYMREASRDEVMDQDPGWIEDRDWISAELGKALEHRVPQYPEALPESPEPVYGDQGDETVTSMERAPPAQLDPNEHWVWRRLARLYEAMSLPNFTRGDLERLIPQVISGLDGLLGELLGGLEKLPGREAQRLSSRTPILTVRVDERSRRVRGRAKPQGNQPQLDPKPPRE